MSLTEEAPLIPPEDKDYEVHDFNTEARFALRSSLPLVVSFLLQYLVSATTIYATGKLGPKELAAASLAVCTFNITGLAVYQGMATSLDSLCSQAYGSGDLHNVGVYFQRCSVMLFAITAVFLLPIWWFSSPLLHLVISDSELTDMVQSFLRVLVFGTPGLLLFETGKRFLQAQHIFNAGTYVLIVTAPLSIFLNYILVWHPVYGIGYLGAPIAVNIVYWTMSLLMLMFVVFVDGKKCWDGLDLRKACTNWSPMLRLALPGVIMVEAEYLAFEILTIFAASFGTAPLAAQSVVANIGSMVFQIGFAVAVTLSTRIGHFVGMKNIPAARVVIRIYVLVGGILGLINFTALIVLRDPLARLFSHDEEVVAITKHILIYSAVNQLCDGYNVLGAGVLRGQGRQRIGSLLNVPAFYAVALPLGYILAFPYQMGLPGLWIGLCVGVGTLAAGEAAAIYKSDWDHIIIEALSRHDS